MSHCRQINHVHHDECFQSLLAIGGKCTLCVKMNGGVNIGYSTHQPPRPDIRSNAIQSLIELRRLSMSHCPSEPYHGPFQPSQADPSTHSTPNDFGSNASWSESDSQSDNSHVEFHPDQDVNPKPTTTDSQWKRAFPEWSTSNFVSDPKRCRSSQTQQPPQIPDSPPSFKRYLSSNPPGPSAGHHSPLTLLTLLSAARPSRQRSVKAETRQD